VIDKSKPTGKQTLVEEGTELKGTLKSSCQVVVNGAIDGQIEAPALTITETGMVLGTVKAERLHSEGTLAGDIDADDVYLSGTVRSNTMIRARTLEVKLAPQKGKLEVTFGECLLEVGDDPAHATEARSDATESAAAGGGDALAEAPQEPTWSEPPRETMDAESDGEREDNGRRARKKKNGESRESQAPPAT
jgi:cytoskeletal protein CcmA (bactofilin family)